MKLKREVYLLMSWACMLVGACPAPMTKRSEAVKRRCCITVMR